MRPVLVLTFTAASALALCGTRVAANPHCNGHGHHGCASGCPCSGGNCDCAGNCGRGPVASGYDAGSVSTLQGTAEAVSVVPPQGRRSGGLHVTLSDGETDAVDVHVGPTWFLEDKGYRIEKGDRLEVTGALLDVGGERHLVAREIRKGDVVFRLRDENGVPLWAGRGRN